MIVSRINVGENRQRRRGENAVDSQHVIGYGLDVEGVLGKIPVDVEQRAIFLRHERSIETGLVVE